MMYCYSLEFQLIYDSLMQLAKFFFWIDFQSRTADTLIDFEKVEEACLGHLRKEQ